MLLTPLKSLSLCLALLAGSAIAADAVTSPAAANTVLTGKVHLYKQKKDTGEWPHDCTITFEAGGAEQEIDLHNDSYGCTNDDDYGFKIENAPSAALISFHSADNCGNGGDFYVGVKTIKNPTTMVEPMGFSQALSYSPGEILVPGVQLTHSGGSKPNGTLSCVWIRPSPLP